MKAVTKLVEGQANKVPMGEYLGHEIGNGQVAVPEHRVQAIDGDHTTSDKV